MQCKANILELEGLKSVSLQENDRHFEVLHLFSSHHLTVVNPDFSTTQTQPLTMTCRPVPYIRRAEEERTLAAHIENLPEPTVQHSNSLVINNCSLPDR